MSFGLPSQTWSYLSGSSSRQCSISCRSTSGNHGLSRQVTFLTKASGGGSRTTKRCHTGEWILSGLKLIHISEPGARMVGTSMSSERSDTVSASSIQQWVSAS